MVSRNKVKEKVGENWFVQSEQVCSRAPFCSTFVLVAYIVCTNTPASNLGYLAPPGQFFMGAKLFIGKPWMRKEGVLKKFGLGYVKLHGFYGNP